MGIKSVETKYMEERESLFRGLKNLSRRDFVKAAGISAGVVASKGLLTPHSFQLVEVAHADEAQPRLTFAYISDSHLYKRGLNDRFVRSILKAVDDVNALSPQPDFVLFGGDLAQLGQKEELELGAQILKSVKAPLKMMVGEHDWFLDMGDLWKSLFGPPMYSFDHKGVHFVTLMSVNERDFWTQRKMTPMERMQTVAGLDNGTQSRFEVGQAGRDWLKNDLAKVDVRTPLVVFSHSPLYKYYRDWNFWTDDADEVQAILSPYQNVTVVHGHTHQLLSNRIGNISFHGMLSTAWPWPYAPTGLPKLTVQMNRPDPFDNFDGCGDGQVNVLSSGVIDKIYNLWDRNPVTVRSSYLASNGAKDAPPSTKIVSYLGDTRTMRTLAKLTIGAALATCATAGIAVAQDARSRPKHAVPPSKAGDLVVGLCDGETSVEVAGVKPGQSLSREQAQDVSNRLMEEWKRKNPSANWDTEALLAQNTATQGANRTDTSAHGTAAAKPVGVTASGSNGRAPVAPNAANAQGPSAMPAPVVARTQDGHTYGAYTARDEAVWRASTQAFLDQGNKIFHDASALGGTIGVSCDMCHPNAANTHPETYPKFQVQLGRVALLRDMINWCIENPVRGKPLADDDPKLKAIEAYILSQRKGVALEYGKH